MPILNKKKWNPPIAHDSQNFALINDCLEKITSFLHTKYTFLTDENRILSIKESISPLTGYLGEVLFLFHRSRYFSSNNFLELGENEIEKVIENLEYNIHPSLGNGISGFVWFLNHLEKNKFIDPLEEELKEHFYSYIQKRSIQDLELGNYDYLMGGLGSVVAFLESQSINTKDSSDLNKILSLLAQTSLETKNGTYWNYRIDPTLNNLNPISYGLAHGVSGILIILIKLNRKGVNPELTSSLSHKLANFILKNKNKAAKGPLYPSFTTAIENAPTINRLGWCYGDLTIAIAFQIYADHFNKEEFDIEANSIVANSINQFNHFEKVTNADFCHGLSGVIHCYNRLYQNNPTPEILNKINELALELINKIDIESDKILLYSEDKKDEKWHSNTGMLNGLSGVAFVLTDLISENHIAWDSIFLLNNE